MPDPRRDRAGPNNYDPIRDHVARHRQAAGLDVEVIEQQSKPVVSLEGRPMFWEDGAACGLVMGRPAVSAR